MRALLTSSLLLLLTAGPGLAQGTESEAAFRFTVARSLSEEGEVDEALTAWNELLDLAPSDPYARMEYARFLVGIGRFAEAVEQVEAGRDLAPGNADALRAAADVYLAAKRVDERYVLGALESLESLAAMRPEDVQVQVDLGRVLLIEVDEPARAAEAFARAVSRRPASRMLQSYLVESLLRARQDSEAERSLTAFLERDPAFLRGRLLLARQMSRRGAYREAVDVLRGAPEGQLGDRDLLWQLASDLYRTGELMAGVEVLDGLLREEPDGFKERALRAMMLGAEGRHDAALEALETLYVERPQNTEVVRTLVRVLERAGRHDRAETVLRQAVTAAEGGDAQLAAGWRLELMNHLLRAEAWSRLAREAEPAAGDARSPLHLQAFFLYVEALHRSGRSEEALARLRAASVGAAPAHRLRAREAEILAELDRVAASESTLAELVSSDELSSVLAAAEVYQRQERYAESVPLLRRALALADDSIRIRYRLGAAYERSGDRERASEQFRKLLAIDPGYAPALNYLGYMWAEEGERLEEAVALVDRAVAQEPDNGAYVDSLGWAYFQLGEAELALGLLERAARLLPENAVVLEHLGDVYAHTGELGRARESYRRALSLGGENREQVRSKLDRLRDGP